VNRSILIRLLALGGLGLAAGNVLAQDIYCWKDEAKITRCGDSVPPDQSEFDREVRNEQGITLRFEEGEITPEEQLAIAERIRLELEQRAALEDQQRRDRVLIDSYLSIEDIEKRRDRIIEQFEGEITVTDLYLANLSRKLESLMRSTQRYAPHSDREDAPPIPENLSLDIERTESSIAMFAQRLKEIQAGQETTRTRFETDIARFRELKGIQD
jgi:hypothetical protein